MEVRISLLVKSDSQKGSYMTISVKVLRKNFKHDVWLASYIPETKEKIWFGYIKHNEKLNKKSFQGGRRPDRQSRSGDTQEEAMRRLYSYLNAAAAAWIEWTNESN